MSVVATARGVCNSSKVLTGVNRARIFPFAGSWPARARRESSAQNRQRLSPRRFFPFLRATLRRKKLRQSKPRRLCPPRNRWECPLRAARAALRCARCRGQSRPPAPHRRAGAPSVAVRRDRSEEHTSELQSRLHLVCRLLLEKKTE